MSPEPGSRSCARKRRSRGGSGRGGLGGRDLGSRGRWTETSGEPAGRARSAGHYLETERGHPEAEAAAAAQVLGSSKLFPPLRRVHGPAARTRAPHPGGGASGGGSDGAEAAALRAARAAPLPAIPPPPSPAPRPPSPAGGVCARVCSAPGPLLACAQRPARLRPRAAPWRPAARPSRLRGSLAPVTCQYPRSRSREKRASFLSHRHTVFYTKSHFYSNILLPLGEYLLSGILVLFFFLSFFFVFFFFFFFPLLCLLFVSGNAGGDGLEPFPEPSFSSRRWGRGRGEVPSPRRPCCGATPARCATGFMEKAM